MSWPDRALPSYRQASDSPRKRDTGRNTHRLGALEARFRSRTGRWRAFVDEGSPRTSTSAHEEGTRSDSGTTFAYAIPRGPPGVVWTEPTRSGGGHVVLSPRRIASALAGCGGPSVHEPLRELLDLATSETRPDQRGVLRVVPGGPLRVHRQPSPRSVETARTRRREPSVVELGEGEEAADATCHIQEEPRDCA